MFCKRIIWICIFLFTLFCSDRGWSDQDAFRAAVRARMALRRLHTAKSSDRTIVVSGPESTSNAFLLESARQKRRDIEHMLRTRLPADEQQIRLQVRRADEDDPDDGQDIILRSDVLLGQLTYRIILPDYESFLTDTAQDALIYAFLSAYVRDAGSRSAIPDIPPWFWQGIAHVLHPDDRKITLDIVLDRWRSGQAPSLTHFLREAQVDRLELDEAQYAGAIVYWLMTRRTDERILPQLFASFAAEESVDANWLRERLREDPDERFDRWLLAQRRTVRGVGTVRQSHIDALEELLLLYPGQNGIPRRADIRAGSPLSSLIGHQDQPWFSSTVRRLRNQLELVAQGRAAYFQEIVDDFLAVLDGILSGEDDVMLRQQEQSARTRLRLFAAEVEESGGIWRDH